MKDIKTLALGFVGGLIGAFLYINYYFSDSEPFTKVKNQDSPAVNFADYSPSFFRSADDFVKAASVSTPCVVYIKTVANQQQSYTWFDYFFNGGNTQSNRVLGSGSGVIFSKDGYIVTNNHVIENATQIEVVHQKRTYIAKIVGIDPSTDLALLKIEANNLPYIKIASSNQIRVGDWVLAVGNPFNLTSTVTAGIVSAKGRNIHILDGQYPIESFIQTDAAINPGNSGGALVNPNGELVGINTAILSKTGSYAGYGFAVPSDMVAKIVGDLKEFGEVQKAFIGAEVLDVNEEIMAKMNLDDIKGVIINYLEAGGAAEKVGLQKGDVILEIDGKEIDSKSNFNEQLSYHKPSDKITIKYKRNNKISEQEIELTNIYGTTSTVKREIFVAKNIGAELENVPEVEKRKLGIANGIRILKVYQNSLISRMDLEAGFIVIAINNREIENPTQLAAILENLRGRIILKGIDSKGVEKLYQYIF